MVERTIDDLTRDLAERRRLGEPAPVVLLGAGASAEAGIGTMGALFAFMHVRDREEFAARIAEITDNERYRLLAEFLQTQDPLEVTAGYRALAALCEAAYFDIVLTTNFDPLLDDALVASGMRRRDYLLLINGVLRADRLQALIGSRSPRVKVLKLHGDLFHRFMAWTPEEMETYLDEITTRVAPSLAMRDFLVVGNSLWDERVRALVVNAGGSVWYVAPEAVPPQVASLKNLRTITGADHTFEHLFPALAKNLGAEESLRLSPRDLGRLVDRGEVHYLEGGLGKRPRAGETRDGGRCDDRRSHRGHGRPGANPASRTAHDRIRARRSPRHHYRWLCGPGSTLRYGEDQRADIDWPPANDPGAASLRRSSVRTVGAGCAG